MSHSVEIFAKWLSCQGYRVERTKSSWWYNVYGLAWQAFPYHWIIEPKEEELREFLVKVHGAGLRYSTGLNSPYGKLSYHAVFEGKNYDLNILSQNARHNVRRGLRRCKIEQITFDRLAEEGWILQVKTLQRQRRKVRISRNKWHKLCLSAADLPGFEAWGALVNGKLVASVITFQMDNCCYMLYQQCDERYLRRYINNALSFVVTKEMLSRPHIKSILYGLHSIDAPPNVDEFKFRMGYWPKPVKQRVVFHPILEPVFNRMTHRFLRWLTHVFPGQSFFSKAEGFVRFGLDSKMPTEQQDWPIAFRIHGRMKERIEKK